ncbi:hypothetical protein P355_0231 [Burkholderia cenocepacia KC-01]|nr:hypothetical protein P355_0231 [Burkholderia cenocepacia KC-01]
MRDVLRAAVVRHGELHRCFGDAGATGAPGGSTKHGVSVLGCPIYYLSLIKSFCE